jgi:hypothetical protein
MKILLAMALAAMPATVPVTGFMTAARLEQHCLATPGDPGGLSDVCIGYLAGSIDQILVRMAPMGLTGQPICLPSNLTIGEVRSTFLAYLQSHSEARPLAAADVMEEAVTVAYPCRLGS